MTDSGAPGSPTERRFDVEPLAFSGNEGDSERIFKNEKQRAEITSLNFAIKQRKDEHEFRLVQARRLMDAFYILNGSVLLFIFTETFLRPRPSPVVTEAVVIALITASAAQLGALALAVGKMLFDPARPQAVPQSPP